MKNVLPILLALFCGLNAANAQCVPDSSILATNALVKPYPSTPSNPASTLNPACAGEAYTQVLTFSIPDTVVLPAIPFPVGLNYASIAPTNAIVGLPTGISYTCNPPDCVFPKNTLGCVKLSGVTNDPPGNDTLTIQLTIGTTLLPFPTTLTFPDQLGDTLVYFIVVKPAGQCNSATIDVLSRISSLKSVPNPFADQTSIVIEALESGAYRFELTDMFGRTLRTERLNLLEGRNDFNFEAGDLPNGTYYYSIGNEQGRAASRLVVTR
jgi:hypothetical protein